ncbi:hypothetical protein [Aquimarina sediminis]|uniref:hypothetical protein n=1 Tax=Aquimarina sediminis TaxID=2070536 RepID=UPI000FFEF731|nr:hypothetical protein [Aquimarina sediminis]
MILNTHHAKYYHHYIKTGNPRNIFNIPHNGEYKFNYGDDYIWYGENEFNHGDDHIWYGEHEFTYGDDHI